MSDNNLKRLDPGGLSYLLGRLKSIFFASPAFTGVPTVPTAENNDYSEQIANTQFVVDTVQNITMEENSNRFNFLEELPEEGQNGLFYFIPSDDPESGVDEWTEFVWNESDGKYERVGTTKIDITGKADKADTVLYSTLSRGRQANTTVGEASFAFGYNVIASGIYSHAEGSGTSASGVNSHAEGGGARASGSQSHAEGAGTTASGANSHAEGAAATANGTQSHAEGASTTANGPQSHAEGASTTANGTQSHAEGMGTIASGNNSHVSGKYNVEDSNNQFAEIIGNGTDANARSNARVLDWSGNERIAGDLYVQCDSDSTNGTKVATVTELAGKIASTEKGAANGVAELDSTGKVPSAQLPSFVDDVLEYDSLSVFPETGEAGKIYVAKDTNKTYRWGGSSYVEISESLALGETSSTAHRGDHGKAAYDHATAKGSAFASGLYKVTTNSEGHVTAATAVQKSDITALGIPAQDTTYSDATQSTHGLMSTADKTKLDGLVVATAAETQAIIDEYGVSA